MTLLVLDASAVVDVLLGNDEDHVLRSAMRTTDHELHTVAHLDAEVLSTLVGCTAPVS